jgi:hypothetical protein
MTAKESVMGISASEKALVGAACLQFISQVLKPRFLPIVRPTQFNYPVDIRGKWHGSRYLFIQRYRSGFLDNLGEEFNSPFTRLDWVGHDRFDLQWRRHTGAWFRLHRDSTLVEALKLIETDGHLHPL